MSARSLLFQSTNFLVAGLGLFAALVPFTIYFATHEASVLAFIGTAEIPTTLVQEVEKALGITPVYRNISYCKPPSPPSRSICSYLPGARSTADGYLALDHIPLHNAGHRSVVLRAL